MYKTGQVNVGKKPPDDNPIIVNHTFRVALCHETKMVCRWALSIHKCVKPWAPSAGHTSFRMISNSSLHWWRFCSRYRESECTWFICSSYPPSPCNVRNQGYHSLQYGSQTRVRWQYLSTFALHDSQTLKMSLRRPHWIVLSPVS